MRPLLMTAPNGARRGKQQHRALPETISECAQTATACRAAGADAMHIHTRNAGGEHCLDAGLSRELLQETARAAPGLPVQITTESAGKYSAKQQRELLYDLRPPYASAAFGEMLADNEEKEAARLYCWAADNGVNIQHILRAPQEWPQLCAFAKKHKLPTKEFSLLFVLGNYQTENTAPAKSALLRPFLQTLQETKTPARFMVCAFGKNETACLVAAAEAGGNCRAGFENNLLHPNGETATDNAERIAEVKTALQKRNLWGGKPRPL